MVQNSRGLSRSLGLAKLLSLHIVRFASILISNPARFPRGARPFPGTRVARIEPEGRLSDGFCPAQARCFMNDGPFNPRRDSVARFKINFQ